MSAQWFSALKRGDNAYVRAYLSEHPDDLTTPDDRGSLCLTIAVLYKNTDAIQEICSHLKEILDDKENEAKRKAILTLLSRGMEACLNNDEADAFSYLRPYILSSNLETSHSILDKAIAANSYSIVEALMRDEVYTTQFLHEKLHSLEIMQSNRLSKILRAHLSTLDKQSDQAPEIDNQKPVEDEQLVRIGTPQDVVSKITERKPNFLSGNEFHSLTEEWMAQATRATLCDTVRSLQAELLKERQQVKKYQEIISSIINDEKQTCINLEKQVHNLASQLERKVRECEEKTNECEALRQLLLEYDGLKLKPDSLVAPDLLPEKNTVENSRNLLEHPTCLESNEVEAIHQQMLLEYSQLKANLLKMGLESSMVNKNFERVSVLAEIAQSEIIHLKRSCLDAIAEAEEIRDRLVVVQHERDVLNTEIVRLRECAALLTIADNEQKGTSKDNPLEETEDRREYRGSESIPLAMPGDVTTEAGIINNMTMQSCLEEDDTKKLMFTSDYDYCNLKRLMEKLAEYSIEVHHTGTEIYLRVLDPARLNTLVQDPMQQINTSILYPSELSVANFCQLDPNTEPSESILTDPRIHPELKRTFVEMYRRITKLTLELEERNRVLAELNEGFSSVQGAAPNTELATTDQKALNKVACILYQRAICERDQMLRIMEANLTSNFPSIMPELLAQKKTESIITREEEILRELFSKASLRHNIIRENSDAIWLEVLTMALQTRNYHLSEYLKFKLARTSNLLHEQHQRGATLHGFVSLNNLAAVYLLAPQFANIRDSNGRTALMVAAELDQLDIVRVLLPYEAGAQTSKGHTALMIAAQLGYLRIVEELSPIEGHIHDQKGRSVIYYATEGSVCKDIVLSKQIVNVLKSYLSTESV